MTDEPVRMHVSHGFSVEDGKVTEHRFGHPFMSSPTECFGPEYIRGDRVQEMIAAEAQQIVAEAAAKLRNAEHKPPKTDFYKGYHGGISDACNMIEKLVAAAIRARGEAEKGGRDG